MVARRKKIQNATPLLSFPRKRESSRIARTSLDSRIKIENEKKGISRHERPTVGFHIFYV